MKKKTLKCVRNQFKYKNKIFTRKMKKKMFFRKRIINRNGRKFSKPTYYYSITLIAQIMVKLKMNVTCFGLYYCIETED